MQRETMQRFVQQDLSGPSDSVQPAHELPAPEVWQTFEARLKQRLQSSQPLASLIGGRLIAAGGKRIRARACLLASLLFGDPDARALDLAVAVELIHSATLLHDDVVDESPSRRGLDSANYVYGNAAPVLVGDFLFSRAFRAMVATGSLSVLDALAGAAEEITESEILQLSVVGKGQPELDDYLRVIQGKTAALFAAACSAPALLAEAPEEAGHLRSFGHHLGMAFQIMNDVMDFLSKSQTLGRTVGDDFREGKWTLPVLLHITGPLSDAERVFWASVRKGSDDPEALRKAIDLMQASGALGRAKDEAIRYGALATEALAVLADGPVRAALEHTVRQTLAQLDDPSSGPVTQTTDQSP